MAEHLAIDRLGHRGDGIADGRDGPIYVAGALPGETVEVAPWPGQPDRRQLVSIDQPSPERIAAICPHFGRCGGCAVQTWREDRYRAWKRGLLVDALRQAGLDTPVGTLVDAHGAGRRRVVLHARRGSSGTLEAGFAAARAHRIVAIDRCPVLAKSLDGALPAARAIAQVLAAQARPLDIQLTATDAGLDVDVRGSGPLPATLTTALARVAAAHDLARLTRHGELIAQRRAPTMRIGRASVPLPPGAFLQATALGEAVLSQLVLSWCGEARHVADLFCGIGPFALRLAERARVFAADDDAAAIAALKRAGAATAGLKPIETAVRDLFRHPLAAGELRRCEAVVFDPPRQGALSQARELAASGVPLIVAVSCNAVTFARDAAELARGGYRLAAVAPVDQFRYAAHVEIVARLEL